MKRTSHTILAALLSLVLVLGIISVPAFAMEEKPKTDDQSVLAQLLTTDFYVQKDEKAGLRSSVKVVVDLTQQSGVVYIPGCADASKLRLAWDIKGLELYRNEKEYQSGKAPLAQAGKSYTYTLKKGAMTARLKIRTIQGSSEVRPLFLEIDESKGKIDSMNLDFNHDTSCYGTLKVGENKKKYVRLKGRGNSTWYMPKKPYNITVYDDGTYREKDKAELIDGVKRKKWTLLANYYDNSLMRNKIAQDLANELGIGLKADYVDVWMNGVFLGNYTLTQKCDSGCPDNGYILENDNYEEEEGQFALSGIHQMAGDHNKIIPEDYSLPEMVYLQQIS